MYKTEGCEQLLSISLLETTLFSEFPPWRGVQAATYYDATFKYTCNVSLLAISKSFLMLTVCRAKKKTVCVQKGTWTDGPAAAGPLSVYMCPIKSAFYSFVLWLSILWVFRINKYNYTILWKDKWGWYLCHGNCNFMGRVWQRSSTTRVS